MCAVCFFAVNCNKCSIYGWRRQGDNYCVFVITPCLCVCDGEYAFQKSISCTELDVNYINFGAIDVNYINVSAVHRH